MSNDSSKPGEFIRASAIADSWLADTSTDFQSNDQIFSGGRALYQLAAALSSCTNRGQYQKAEAQLAAIRTRLHERLQNTNPHTNPTNPHTNPANTTFAQACHANSLTPLECETLLILVLSSFGLLDNNRPIHDIDDLQKLIRPSGVDPFGVMSALASGSKLAQSGLLQVSEGNRPLDATIRLSEKFTRSLWDSPGPALWHFETRQQAHDQLRRIAQAGRKQIERTEEDEFLDADEDHPEVVPYSVGIPIQNFYSAVKEHPQWPLTQTLQKLEPQDRAIVLLLMSKELGHLPQDHRMFNGFGIASTVSVGPAGLRHVLTKLRKGSTLRTENLIRPCGGMPPGVLEEDDAILREAEFELTSTCRKALGIQRQWRCRSGNLRKANTQLQNLILHEEVTTALAHALEYAKRPERLLDDWGLRAMIPYGHGTTMLFTGPPGVGKTAAAEAFARELDKPILVIDYSALQSCWVGETEKNVVRAFREAADEDAVLFFDEADAVFYNRDSAVRNWEVSEVNVLLKEVEAFAGVCILATNRDTVLDPALERRIGRRIRFAPPTPAMSAQIWQKLIPPNLPLLGKPDFAQLGAVGLTGGQIKNAVLNAARAAACRGGEGADVGEGAGVMMEDFSAAAEIEAGRVESGGIGFGVKSNGGTS